MDNRWDLPDALDDPLAECVHASRLIGSDPSLVLHGGGNTSVVAPWTDVTGETIDALYVKGSGWDLARIEAEGFAPLPLPRLMRLLELETLSDAAMMTALSAARLDPAAPQPSVESLLHAFIPHPAVLHSHADAIVTLTNTDGGEELVRRAMGDDVMIVPYVMPGFDLARAVAESWPRTATDATVGMVLAHHGLFTFGPTSRLAYERHVELISRAETWLDRHAPWVAAGGGGDLDPVDRARLARLRRRLSMAAGRPVVVERHAGPDVSRFVSRPDLTSLTARGPLTPDHVIRTKRVPLVGDDVEGYAVDYRAYVERHRDREGLVEVDPAPRVVLDPALGMLTVGFDAEDAGVAADIYRHTIPVLERSEDHLGGYRALDERDVFDVEYWDLEQAKLTRRGTRPEMTGQVAVVTGAASGIGRACAATLLERGAAVIGLDVAPEVGAAFEGAGWLGLVADVTDPEAVETALTAGVERFGGVDLAILAAGVFGPSTPLADLDLDEWRGVQAVNADSAAHLLALLHPLLALSPASPAVTVVASRNVPAPGRGAAAYSASKAALTQLARVAALEWAEDGIRVNTIHPDAVFDTGLWTEQLLQERATRHGSTVEEYKRRNLLSVDVTSSLVAGVVVDLLSPRFAATTGAQIPVDGGSERVI
jgi:rhamnose utilization protein RhaD (predicted bifunctional aldolase and dehydrogenase)/NAD(P)-dependent dehydrogenase (short-subunit alcohol dehydrogenase family)